MHYMAGLFLGAGVAFLWLENALLEGMALQLYLLRFLW